MAYGEGFEYFSIRPSLRMGLYCYDGSNTHEVKTYTGGASGYSGFFVGYSGYSGISGCSGGDLFYRGGLGIEDVGRYSNVFSVEEDEHGKYFVMYLAFNYIWGGVLTQYTPDIYYPIGSIVMNEKKEYDDYYGVLYLMGISGYAGSIGHVGGLSGYSGSGYISGYAYTDNGDGNLYKYKSYDGITWALVEVGSTWTDTYSGFSGYSGWSGVSGGATEMPVKIFTGTKDMLASQLPYMKMAKRLTGTKYPLLINKWVP